MQIHADLDDKLFHEAMQASPAASEKDVIEEGLRLLVEERQRRLGARLPEPPRNLWGIGWEGDLEEMRNDSIEEFDVHPDVLAEMDARMKR